MIFDVDDLTNTPVKKQEKKIIPETFDKNKVIKMHRHLSVKKDDFFNEEKFPHGFVFYDFEVFLYDWMVVLIDPINCTKDIIVNDREALIAYYNEHVKMIWVGYNNLHYDVPILKGIILGMNPKKISDDIIVNKKSAWEISKDFYKVELISYDVSDKVHSLKVLEAFMGDSIQETSVPFDIPRQLKLEEVLETIKYCMHDVEETIEVFKYKINDFNANSNLIEVFDFPFNYISKTKGQITAMVTDCEKKEHNDEFDITILPCIDLGKYEYVKQWFLEMCKQHNYSKPLDEKKFSEIVKHGKQVIKKSKNKRTCAFQTTVCGIPHIFAWGGVHGAADEPVHIDSEDKE